MSPGETNPGQTDARYSEADQILKAVRGIVRSVTIHSKRLLRDTGMTLPQVLCLRAIDAASRAESRATAAEVAREVQLSPATVTGIIDRLERGEFVERERDTADRRKVYLRLTAKGQEWLNTLPSNLQDRVVERLNSLAPERRRAILDALGEIVMIMEAVDIDTAPMLVAGEQPSVPDVRLEIERPRED